MSSPSSVWSSDLNHELSGFLASSAILAHHSCRLLINRHHTFSHSFSYLGKCTPRRPRCRLRGRRPQLLEMIIYARMESSEPRSITTLSKTGFFPVVHYAVIGELNSSCKNTSHGDGLPFKIANSENSRDLYRCISLHISN